MKFQIDGDYMILAKFIFAYLAFLITALFVCAELRDDKQ